MEKDEDGFITGVPPTPAPAAATSSALPEEPDNDLVDNDYQVDVKLADQQADKNSPLYSVKTFEELGLHQNLLDGIRTMRFVKPSKIQEKALPLLLSNPPTNFIGQSQSGTGKTAAFVLTMLSRIDFDLKKPQALCLAPSRELARQIMVVVNQMGALTGVQTEYAIKDHIKGMSEITAHIVIGTPGTVLELNKKRILNFQHLKVLVLDEADNMLDQDGLGEQTVRVKNFISKRPDHGRNIQLILFSATFTDKVRAFADKFAPGANKIELKKQEVSVDSIKQFYMDCTSEAHKYEILVSLYSLLTIGQSIIFCQYRGTADKISQRMTKEGHKVVSLHGAKDAAERDQIIDAFRAGSSKVLITTNVIARGIDILQVNMVVNYDLPRMNDRGAGGVDTDKIDIETYIHRIGRTGRFGRKGVSINFVHDNKTREQMLEIERATGRHIERVDTGSIDEMEEVFKKALKA